MKAAGIWIVEVKARGGWMPTSAAALTEAACNRLIHAMLEGTDASDYRATLYVRAAVKP